MEINCLIRGWDQVNRRTGAGRLYFNELECELEPNAAPGQWLVLRRLFSDGSKLLAAGSGLIRSSDSGVNWIQAELPSGYNWTSVSSSSDGTRLVAARTITASASLPERFTPRQIRRYLEENQRPETFWTDVISSGDGDTRRCRCIT
jgi:hypothetical protein